jgi:RimJ/RimL family protein N-acetyltransferase
MKAMAMAWYPPTAPVPSELHTKRFWLRPLRGADAELDYEAIMSSATELRRWSQGSWPAADFTLEQNRADLERHEREHQAREAFTYTVLNPDENRCLGCVYLTPLPPATAGFCTDTDASSSVAFWVRTSEWENDLDTALLAMLRSWFATVWNFSCVVFVVSQRDQRQTELLTVAGLFPTAFALPDGRACWGFVERL